VIGDGNGWYAHLLAAREQVGNSRRPIEHRILRVHVQVDE
jgi:hypothetical protein